MKNNLKLVCPKCGTPHQPHSPHTMDADGFERLTNGEVEYWCQYQNIFRKWKNRIKYDMFGMACYAVFYSFEDAYEFNYGKKEEEKVKVVDSCYKKRW